MSRFTGRRVLVVEDELIVAMMLEDFLSDLGATIVGPAATVEEATLLAGAPDTLDAAILDLNLHGQDTHAVADLLAARGVPFVFATGYGMAGVPGHDAPVLQKPYRQDQVETALERLLKLA